MRSLVLGVVAAILAALGQQLHPLPGLVLSLAALALVVVAAYRELYRSP